ncbi:MAG: alpha-amylase family glycosyl hydrolase [Bacilli bacterium]
MMIKKTFIIFLITFISLLSSGCDQKKDPLFEAFPRNDIYYEVFVRSFSDSDGDGIGDIQGIIEKLDYLEALGVTGLWLMPIHPSPSYHGYDITDYYGINPDYGTLADFKNLLKETEKRNIKIMLDMVFNHTSNRHPWFLAALANDEKYRDYYTFSTPSTDRTLLGSWGQNIWHQQDDQYYVGYFSPSMPDLNYYNTEVHDEIEAISKYWIDLGVDGFRLDAAAHFYGINEYQDKRYDDYENIIFLQLLRKHVRDLNPYFYLTGEIYITAESIVAPYFRGLDSPLDFPIALKVSTIASSNGSSTYVNGLMKIYSAYEKQNADFLSAPFLFNHDMDRISDQFGHDLEKMKLAAEMLLTLPGSPILYYGEEVGMKGVKSNGELSDGLAIWDETRRLPIPFGDAYQTTWFADENFPSVIANQTIDNVNVQMTKEDSLFNTYKKIIAVRKANIALYYGNNMSLYENNSYQIQGFYREFTHLDFHQKVLVIHNLSRNPQPIAMLGDILYLSNTDDYTNVTEIPPKSTIIFDVTEDDNA